MQRTFKTSSGLLFNVTVEAVTFGCLAHFLALSLWVQPGKDNSQYLRCRKNPGHGVFRALQWVHMPMIRGMILTVGMLIFLDCIKELPLTATLGPFNFNALAAFVHQYASDEQLGEASLAALSIVGFGILQVIVFSFAITSFHPGHVGGGS